MPNPWVHLDGDPLMPAPIPNPIILPDFGNKANYRLGETVTFSVFDDRYTDITVVLNGRVALHLPVSREGSAAFCPEAPGHYETFAVSTEGKTVLTD